jgi:lipopolysaccharide transport system ATP-binding protein
MSYLRVKNLGKAYKRYQHKWGRFVEWVGRGIHHERIWVLRDVSFNVEPGEAVGIIGANGAGKSTLLKMITGTTKPTTGSVEAGGRISALLELGMGFHSDFTGRQNVYMAGHLRGMSSDEIGKKMHEIEDFAEIGDYIDQPVRVYSSGMMVRLAFSVVTAVRPDILVIDEALSVGDTYFQHKSFDRIRKFRDKGTTLLFVSHSPGAIKTLCDRAILLDQGVVLRDDMPDAVLDYYNAVIAKQQADYAITQAEQLSGRKFTRSGGGEASINAVELLVDGKPVRALRSGASATIRVSTICHKLIEELTVGILIRDRFGNDVFGTNTYYHSLSRRNVKPGEMAILEFAFPSMNLGRGSYTLTVALHKRDTHLAANYDWWDRALVFQVIPGESPLSIGVCDFPVSITWLDTAM